MISVQMLGDEDRHGAGKGSDMMMYGRIGFRLQVSRGNGIGGGATWSYTSHILLRAFPED